MLLEELDVVMVECAPQTHVLNACSAILWGFGTIGGWGLTGGSESMGLALEDYTWLLVPSFICFLATMMWADLLNHVLSAMTESFETMSQNKSFLF
jgi:4-hydroxybenzoate polyprenyltransferase